MANIDMNVGDAALGLFQHVDPTWNFVVSCDWQCKPQEQTTTMAEESTPATLQSTTLDENDAQIGLYQLVDPSWNYVSSCEWQCKPENQQLQPREDIEAEVAVSGEHVLEKVLQPPARTKCNVPLAESDAQIGLHQLVDHRWNFVVSCDWQCKPTTSKRKSKPKRGDAGKAETGSVPLDEADESGVVPLLESDARLGLYQLVNPKWNFVVSCDWQCRPLGESEEMEESGKPIEDLELEEDYSSTSSLSACREDEGRPSLFQQTGDIMMILVGDKGEEGLVMIDDELRSAERLMAISKDVTLDEQAAEKRKRALANLKRYLGGEVKLCLFNQTRRVLGY